MLGAGLTPSSLVREQASTDARSLRQAAARRGIELGRSRSSVTGRPEVDVLMSKPA